MKDPSIVSLDANASGCKLVASSSPAQSARFGSEFGWKPIKVRGALSARLAEISGVSHEREREADRHKRTGRKLHNSTEGQTQYQVCIALESYASDLDFKLYRVSGFKNVRSNLAVSDLARVRTDGFCTDAGLLRAKVTNCLDVSARR